MKPGESDSDDEKKAKPEVTQADGAADDSSKESDSSGSQSDTKDTAAPGFFSRAKLWLWTDLEGNP